MISVGAFFGTFLGQAPVFAVLVVGLILLGTQGQRLPPRSRQLARLGLVIMLIEGIASMLWTALLPQLLSRRSYDHDFFQAYSIASAIVAIILSLLFAIGLGLLIAALMARQPGPPGGSAPPAGWPPPAGSAPPAGWGPPPPGGSAPPAAWGPPPAGFGPPAGWESPAGESAAPGGSAASGGSVPPDR